MTFFTNTVQSSHSQSGFKFFINIKSILFCCYKTESPENTTTIMVVDKENETKEKLPIVDNNVNDNKIEETLENDRNNDNINENKILNDEKEILNDENVDTEDSKDKILSEKEGEPSSVKEKLTEDELQNNVNEDEVEEPKNEVNVESNDDVPIEESQDELSQNEILSDQTPDENLNSANEDFDNLSEHELNMAIGGVIVNEKVEKTKTGDLRLKIGLDPGKSSISLLITIIEAHDFLRPSSSTNSIREHSTVDVPAVIAYSVHILVMQLKKQRFKTKMRQGPDPYFDEIIKIPKVNQDEAKKWCLRFRLYGSLRNSIKQIIGEGYLPLENLDLENKTQCDIALMTHDPNITEEAMNTLMYASQCKLQPTNSLLSIDKISNFMETGTISELLVGLAFNTNTGRLTIEIKHGKSFPKLKDNKSPDSFLKILLFGNKGEEMFNAKSAVKKGSCDPIFEEAFIFQVFMFQLDDTSLLIEGYHKLKLGKKYHFGTITIGTKSPDEEGVNHWKDLITSKTSEEILRWHNFILDTK